ncbi:PREDICTED: uncharacterized protein C15orf65 homolog [Eurypyga helias]|uniref:uncharacterized protein C15orf65 homolog n=1 Tax=Eurypyga helias TaxID=54383 RepID=UPI000528C0D5|nr:PREDICTED: uncharacterized protein C15orf65 homolog [Eurypyga helias]
MDRWNNDDDCELTNLVSFLTAEAWNQIPVSVLLQEKLSVPESHAPRREKMTSAEKLPSSPNAEQNQSPHLPLCTSPGNPVFSCMLDPKTLMTNGSLRKPQVLLFKTSSSEYGAIPPVPQMVPCHQVRTLSKTNLLICLSAQVPAIRSFPVCWTLKHS